MMLGIFIGSFDAFVLLMGTFADIQLLSPQTVIAINAVLGFLILPAKLIMQNIPATPEQKLDCCWLAALGFLAILPACLLSS